MSELERLVSRLTQKSYRSGETETGGGKIRFGRMSHATSSARVTGPCGETMEMHLRVIGERIKEGSLFTNGCGASVLCATVALALAIGKDLDSAAMVEGDTILGVVKDLPEDHHHCAHLAASTLQTAIHNHFAKPPHRRHLAP